ncbi:MFS transporter [Paraburkholderia tropica]|uniref:MFS transporter n=1 Tax=Paraburkholderia tropica TaxID=92647 RepID=UPI000A5A24FD|nr:MFS transporter [Paraburkholderia tropica]
MMAAACGITVANVYLSQPLLSLMAKTFHASATSTGMVASAAQIGYALGILLVVPIADRADPKRLIRTLLALTTVALLCAAASPTLPVLILMSLAVTVATVVPQALIPVAVAISPTADAGKIVGTMQTGLILGILLSRTASGAIGQFSHSWRMPYLVAAVLTGSLFFFLPRYIPHRNADAGQSTLSYMGLLRSLPTLLYRWRGLRFSALLGATMFGAFSAFWATLAFHLAQPPFGLGPAQAGLFGLWGAAGALLAPRCGRLADRFGPRAVNVLSLGAGAAAFIVFIIAGDASVIALVIGVNLLDFANQSGQIANQARIFKLDPASRARLNTVYMVFTFAGGAVGSALGTTAWSAGRWFGVCTAGAVLIGLAAGLMLFHRWFRDTPATGTA